MKRGYEAKRLEAILWLTVADKKQPFQKQQLDTLYSGANQGKTGNRCESDMLGLMGSRVYALWCYHDRAIG